MSEEASVEWTGGVGGSVEMRGERESEQVTSILK